MQTLVAHRVSDADGGEWAARGSDADGVSLADFLPLVNLRTPSWCSLPPVTATCSAHSLWGLQWVGMTASGGRWARSRKPCLRCIHFAPGWGAADHIVAMQRGDEVPVHVDVHVG